MIAERSDPGPTQDPAPAERDAPAGFVNAEVPLDALPGTETVDWLPLHSRFARRLQVGALIRSAAFLAVAGAMHAAVRASDPNALAEVPWLPWSVWTLLGAFCAWSVVWPLVAVPRRGYAVREKDLLYKTGVLWRSVRAFPFNRVQHTKLDTTLLDRRFDLASLSVFPAGGGRGNRIRGLGRETAERLRVYISERIESESDERSGAAGDAGR